jgi:hypothetical protein
MPSIYPQLKDSDRKFIRREKARIRAQFSDVKKQEELISALYQKALALPIKGPKPEVKEEAKEPEIKKTEVKIKKKVAKKHSPPHHNEV